jgi:hypothetical protein
MADIPTKDAFGIEKNLIDIWQPMMFRKLRFCTVLGTCLLPYHYLDALTQMTLIIVIFSRIEKCYRFLYRVASLLTYRKL